VREKTGGTLRLTLGKKASKENMLKLDNEMVIPAVKPGPSEQTR